MAPTLRSVLGHTFDQSAVLVIGPRPLNHFRVEDFLPAVEALDVRAVLQLVGDPLPVFGLTRDQNRVNFGGTEYLLPCC